MYYLDANTNSGWLDAFDRHWAWYEPEECEG